MHFLCHQNSHKSEDMINCSRHESLCVQQSIKISRKTIHCSVHESLCWMEFRETFKAKSWISQTSTALGSYLLRFLLSSASFMMHCCKWLVTSYRITSPASVLSPATFVLTAFPQKMNRLWLHVCWWMGTRYVTLVGKWVVTDTKQTFADGFSECFLNICLPPVIDCRILKRQWAFTMLKPNNTSIANLWSHRTDFLSGEW